MPVYDNFALGCAVDLVRATVPAEVLEVYKGSFERGWVGSLAGGGAWSFWDQIPAAEGSARLSQIKKFGDEPTEWTEENVIPRPKCE